VELKKEAINNITNATIVLASKKGDPAVKVAALETVVEMQVAYYSKFCSWKLSEYEELDALCIRLVKSVTGNRISIANDLMIVPKKFGGFGYRKLSNFVQRMKLRMMESGLQSELTATYVRGMLARVRCYEYGPFYTNRGGEIMPSRLEDWWASSLIEYLNGLSLKFQKYGNESTGLSESVLLAAKRLGIEVDVPSRLLLCRAGIKTVNDFLVLGTAVQMFGQFEVLSERLRREDIMITTSDEIELNVSILVS
jgi:hypothetical protein